jgi:replicative superfamily II helicase
LNTFEYPYYIQPFPEYNIAQRSAIPFADQDVNLVISFATSTGKTAIACAAFGYHLKMDSEDKRVAYVSPFKSLSSEKYEQWKIDDQFEDYGIMLSTGDNTPTTRDYRESRMVVITNESFDSKTRNEKYRDWLEDISCIVFDEAHLLGTERGAAMESSLMRFSGINKDARLILLSATMSNAKEIAKWVKQLNGKQTKFIHSDWRPNKVDIGIRPVEDGYLSKIDEAISIASEDGSKKTIVFVHSKKVGAEIVKGLRKKGVRCAFHNASLPQAKRKKIENLFNSNSGMNVIVATSTLSAGVNLGG